MSDSNIRSEKRKNVPTSGEVANPESADNEALYAPEIESENKTKEPATASDASDRIAALEARLAETAAELNKFRDLAFRSTADLDNYRKRMTKEREEAIKFANSGFLERLIPVLDNFDFGLQAARGTSNPDSILDGLAMVHKQFQDFLSSAGIEVIDATGQRFDPQLHEAISQEESEQVPEGVVIRQLRKGYKLRDRLIRPANVVVSKGAPFTVSTRLTES
jgi:molecular chaperone GrpE